MVKGWLAILLFLCWQAAGAHPMPESLVRVVAHEVRTHHALSCLRNDWQGGFAGQAPLPPGEFSDGRTTLPVTLAPAGIDVVAWMGGTDTAPLVVMALMWMMFFGGLGAAQWRARRSPA